MGQHTWFLKSKELYDKQQLLYNKLDQSENNEIYLDGIEVLQISHEIDEIDKINKAEYHDLFRTNKRQIDNSYIEEVISSKEECFNWIENQNNKVSFYNDKEYSINKLNEFWDKYPDGLIYFG